MKKLRPFLAKHRKQGGVGGESSLQRTHLPGVFVLHVEVVQQKIRNIVLLNP